MSNSPTWRQMFDAWEKAVAPGLEEMTASPGFQDVLALSARLNASVTAEAERLSRQWLHFWNLPTATDVRKLRQQISTLEREVQTLRRSLRDESDPVRPDLDLVEPMGDELADAS